MLKRVKGVSALSKVPDMLFPLVWADEVRHWKRYANWSHYFVPTRDCGSNYFGNFSALILIRRMRINSNLYYFWYGYWTLYQNGLYSPSLWLLQSSSSLAKSELKALLNKLHLVQMKTGIPILAKWTSERMILSLRVALNHNLLRSFRLLIKSIMKKSSTLIHAILIN